MRKKHKTIMVDEETLKALRKVAGENNCTMAGYIRKITKTEGNNKKKDDFSFKW